SFGEGAIDMLRPASAGRWRPPRRSVATTGTSPRSFNCDSLLVPDSTSAECRIVGGDMAQESSGLGLFAAFMFGFMAGAIVLAALFARFRDEKPATSWVYISLFCFAVMAAAAVGSAQLSFARAILVIPIGSAALIAAAQAVVQLAKGETIELTSHW